MCWDLGGFWVPEIICIIVWVCAFDGEGSIAFLKTLGGVREYKRLYGSDVEPLDEMCEFFSHSLSYSDRFL